MIFSEKELSVNLRYIGDGATPPVNVTATALAKNTEGKPVTMGSSSPDTVTVYLNGDSTLYDSNSINATVSSTGTTVPQPQPLRYDPYQKVLGYEPPQIPECR
jgi:hypothetical protein